MPSLATHSEPAFVRRGICCFAGRTRFLAQYCRISEWQFWKHIHAARL